MERLAVQALLEWLSASDYRRLFQSAQTREIGGIWTYFTILQ